VVNFAGDTVIPDTWVTRIIKKRNKNSGRFVTVLTYVKAASYSTFEKYAPAGSLIVIGCENFKGSLINNGGLEKITCWLVVSSTKLP
jgi:hypothetical protein